jgi:hypothetical protein
MRPTTDRLTTNGNLNRNGEYPNKLRDPRWQRMRLEIMSRDEFRCQRCLDSKSTLHVHHRYYLANKDPWDYPLEALVTLCEGCHEFETKYRREDERLLIRAMQERFFAEQVSTLANAFGRMEFTHDIELVTDAIAWAVCEPQAQKELVDRFFLDLRERRSVKVRK